MPRPPRRRATRVALAALAALLTCAGVAYAAVGLVNPSFENDLDGWTAQTIREAVYEQEAEIVAPDCATAEAARRSVCVVGTDTFMVTDSDGEGQTTYTVTPVDGAKMARLGGPYASEDESQPLDRYQLKQSFQVDPENPVLKVNYNVFTFDYSGYDELRVNVRLVDANGSEIAQFVQGAFGSGTSLKTTGWQSGHVDLTGYENQTVHLLIDSGGTSDNAYAFWAYVDAGEVPVPPVSAPQVGAPEGVEFQVFADENTGQTWINIPNSVVNGPQFDGCLPLDINLPINPGENGGVVSDVSLIHGGGSLPMTDPDGDGTWFAHIDCVSEGQLMVQYTLTEEGVSQTFLIPIGGIVLIDPAGVIYDQATFDALNTTPADASDDDGFRAQAAIKGAKVRLQRKTNGVWNNVLSGDPGISPNVNPQTTGDDGRYAWDVEAGDWRVVVSAAGYENTISREVTVPPPVLDLHVGMVKTGAAQPPDDDGDGVPNSSDACPNQAGPGTANGCPAPPNTPPADTDKDGKPDASDACPTVPGTLPNGCPHPAVVKPAPCAGKTGKKLAACKRKVALQKKIAKCNKIKAKGKRKTCVKKAKALSKCSAIKNKKKKASCVKKAKKIGAKPKGAKKKKG